MVFASSTHKKGVVQIQWPNEMWISVATQLYNELCMDDDILEDSVKEFNIFEI